MLGVGLKKGESAPVGTCLGAYIQSNHKDDAKALESAIGSIDKARSTVLQGFDRLETGVIHRVPRLTCAEMSPELVLEWYKHCTNLANRFPFGNCCRSLILMQALKTNQVCLDFEPGKCQW